MNYQTTIWVRCAGAAACLGGLVWGVAIVAMALRPPGVPGLSYRTTQDLTLPMELALVLVLAGLLGLHRGTASRTGRTATAAVTIVCSGVAILVAGGTMMAFGNDWAWAVSVPGAFAAMVGFALFAVSAWRANALRRFDGMVLLVAVLVLLGFNTEDWRAWLGLPFGAAWMWLGAVLLTESRAWRASATISIALSMLIVFGLLGVALKTWVPL